ncbi:MAG: hypothetical protein Unbinned4098contig1000_32 [Prokaryotic dsDNA virus sp.]|nr:MAG: hypothetical protein Unbinned4098contig1000_32 [Prokaryotic dsDNA virus sp.]|tara:strand:- start:12632 stop:12934 length:303 start_codon:yes stop_codon:yes gene_type:complete
MTEDTKNNTLDLGNGHTLKFGRLVAWDMIAIQRELGTTLDKADGFESSLALSWRAARHGGFEGDFEDFCRIVPMDKLEEVSLAAAPFLGKDIEPVEGVGC